MKREYQIVTALLIAIATLILATSCKYVSGTGMGKVIQSWETSNHTFKVRVDMHAEERDFANALGGAYYVFQSAPSGSNAWREVMTVRNDDPISINHDQVRFVNDRVGYVFMLSTFAVTMDSGATWSVLNIDKDLAKWDCCELRFIKDVRIEPDGTGMMIIDAARKIRGEVPELHTKDFGQHWNL